jgi:hypothetical protein
LHQVGAKHGQYETGQKQLDMPEFPHDEKVTHPELAKNYGLTRNIKVSSVADLK